MLNAQAARLTEAFSSQCLNENMLVLQYMSIGCCMLRPVSLAEAGRDV